MHVLSRPALCDPMDCTPLGSSVFGILSFWGGDSFSRQEYWSGSPCLPPGDLPDTGIEHGSPALQAYSLPPELPGKPLKVLITL